MTDVARVAQQRSGLNMSTWRQKVWRWEHYGVVPEAAAQHALATELGIDVDAVGQLGWPNWLTLVDPAETVHGAWTAEAAQSVIGRVVESVAVDRREFLVYTGARLSAMAEGWSQTPTPVIADDPVGGPVSDGAVESLHQRASALWLLDDNLDGGTTLEPSLADLRLAYTLMRCGTGRSITERRLYSAIASLARFAGWAAFDAGRLGASQRLWHAALRAAHAAADTVQAVYVLSNLALQMVYSGDSAGAVSALEAARSRVDPAERIVSTMLDTWQVRAKALQGEHPEAQLLLNCADNHWGARKDGDDPDHVHWTPQSTLTAEAVATMRRLRHAEQILSVGLAALDPASARDRNICLIQLAETQHAAGRLDEAVDSRSRAVDDVAESIRTVSPVISPRSMDVFPTNPSPTCWARI